jgi:hypothetical protein
MLAEFPPSTMRATKSQVAFRGRRGFAYMCVRGSGCFVVDGLASCPSTRELTGAAMRVTKVLDPASNTVSFTVISEIGVVEPAERYLRSLADTERSPNTIKAHAHDLKDWIAFLSPATSLRFRGVATPIHALLSGSENRLLRRWLDRQRITSRQRAQ